MLLSTGLDDNFSNTNCTTAEIDERVEAINSTLKEAFEAACPPTYISSSVRKPPWLTSEVEEAQRGLRRKLMLARSTKKDRAWQALRSTNLKYNKLVSKSKQQAWRSFCQDTESVKESARMNKILKSSNDNKVKLEAVYKPNGKLTSNAEETLEVMSEVHFKGHDHDLRAPTTNTSEPPDDLLKTIYHPDRLLEAVNSFDPFKAAGPDTLRPIVIQKAWNNIKENIQHIMVQNHKLQHIPEPWKESLGIFIPKPGKTDYNHPKSYRTITLSPVLLKLQEKVLLWHMQHDLNIATDLNKRQFGFRKGSSTEAALHKVANKIERRIAKKGYVLGVFLDIEGAFDNVSFNAISEALSATKVDDSTAKWIINMVTHRYITINHKSSTKRIRVSRGCPQGGILSPFLWNLVVDSLLNYSAKDIPGYLQAFADDLVSLAEGNDTDVIWERTQRTLKTISTWCQSKGLNISAMKTKVVMFTWNRKWTMRPLKLGNSTIELSKSARFLGVTLDNKLNFNEHITNITKKATASLMQCRRAVGPTWGLTPKTCRWIYTAVIRPILSYSVSIWIRTTLNKSNATKLERVQAMALRIMTGALPSTPFRALDHITNTPTIINYLRGEAAKGASRLQGYGDWSMEPPPPPKGTINAHTNINNIFLQDLDIPKRNRDLTIPTLNLDQNFKITIPGEKTSDYRESLSEIINNTPPHYITCYTDGSKIESRCGAGYIITTNNNTTTIHEASHRLPDYCSVYQAELTAIREACNFLLETTNEHIIIWTDSLSSLMAIRSNTIRSKTVAECLNAIRNIATANTVELRWIAAHTGLWGNERADELAKLGTTHDDILLCPFPQSRIKHLINSKVQRLDTAKWIKNKHTHTDSIIGSNELSVISQLNNNYIKNKKSYRTILHMITGHCGLNKHLYNINRSHSKMCPNCEESEETVEHFLGQCPATALLRGNTFYNHYMTSRDIFKRYSLTTITKFIRLTNRFIDPDNLGLPKVTCAQVLWHHSWLAPLLPSGRSLLRSPLQLFTRDRQSLFDTIFSWALQSPAPFQRIEMFALLFSDL